MVSSITVLLSIAYAISKHAGSGTGAEVLSELFGDAAGNAFHGDIEKLRTAFLTVTRPERNEDLERSTVRSALHANLFCLMEALGESLGPPQGNAAKWLDCVLLRVPQSLRELNRPLGGFLSEVERTQLLRCKVDCEKDLEKLEEVFLPVDIEPNRLLIPPDQDFTRECSEAALAAIEAIHGALPQRVRDIFYEKWFGYLCNSFRFEIKHNQPISNILLNLSVAQLSQHIDERFRETNRLIRDSIRPTKSLLDPFATVPPLPPSFVGRPEFSEPIIESLLSCALPISITAIEGMGGVGKTIVANSICHDPRIRRAFSDGIVWLTVGKQVELPPTHLIQQIAQSLNQEFETYAAASYRSMLAGKCVLVVLDDVWELEAVEPFLMDSGRSRLIYTTRDRSLAGILGAENHEVGVLSDLEARRFLRHRSGSELVEMPEPYASEILAECKGLVLGLAMIGGALKGQPETEWSAILAALQRAQLKEIGSRIGGYSYQTLYSSIAASVEALDSVAKSHYLKLAVLLEDMPASGILLRALWGADDRDVQRTMRLFVDRSLARRDAEGSIRLHDFQLDFVRSEHSCRRVQDLVHSALLRSIHVIHSHPEQFTSQMIGRLLVHRSEPEIQQFIDDLDVCCQHPRIRPIRVALDSGEGRSVRVLAGHTAPILAAAVANDGKLAVSGCTDGTLWIWNLQTNHLPQVLHEGDGPIKSVVLSGDGKLAVSAHYDGAVRIWDLVSLRLRCVLYGHTRPVNAVAMSADSDLIVSGSNDGTARIWNLQQLEALQVFSFNAGVIFSVAITQSGKRAIAASADGHLWTIDFVEGSPARIRSQDAPQIKVLAISADGKRAVDVSQDRKLRVWDLDDNSARNLTRSGNRPGRAVALTADGKRAVFGSRRRTFCVWDIGPPEGSRYIFPGHQRDVSAVAVTADGKLVISGSGDKTLRVWELDRRDRHRTVGDHDGPVRAVAISFDGKLAISGSSDGKLKLWSTGSGKPSRMLETRGGPISAVAISSTAKLGLFGSSDGLLRVWSLGGKGQSFSLAGHREPIRSVAIDEKGERAVSGSDDAMVIVWDLKKRQLIRTLKGHADTVKAIAMTRDGELAVSGSWDKTLRVWDLNGQRASQVMRGHTDKINSVAISPNGKRVISASDDKTLLVWSLRTMLPLRQLTGHLDSITSVAVSPEGGYVASGSRDHTLRIWNLNDGRCLAVFTNDAPILTCSWGANHIVFGDKDSRVNFVRWED